MSFEKGCISEETVRKAMEWKTYFTFTANKFCKGVGQLSPYNKNTSKIWRNYKKQKVVLLDDIDKDNVKYIKTVYLHDDNIIINLVNYIMIITSTFNPEDFLKLRIDMKEIQ
ncbi:hypothetical protein ENUP19_0072G0002 [Entamoeba nuttalli]|uniref:Helicase superfamily 3 single-stranded DNA/RNA virus domain-containing protein n=1 Tax=Entamoeba nuttalli TaxID=412467 RepID=A0ABQ0DEE7_9EUKA